MRMAFFLDKCANLVILATEEKQTKSIPVLWVINGITYDAASDIP